MVPSLPLPSPMSSPPVERESRREYEPLLGNVGAARRWAARLAIEWGHPDPAPTVALVAGELAANAVLHGCFRQRPFGVRVVLHGAALRVEVSDGRADRLPFRRSAGPQETFGRGLLLVEAVADRWGVTVDAGGKTVWAEVDVPPEGSAGRAGEWAGAAARG
ncbi:ATP-binding protein [Streptomyces sp. ST2-7A]|uniref:ATP-binding protein n=1 Tax=Streptomyces sp. ST2-7A TaxID=2907214 RepID=UPI001F1FA2F8|nr:ATP-binding protein [Streptomyces sp. ST2-7A]